MARLIDFGGEVNSNLVSGLGTNTVTFTMPGNIGLSVESVLATINNAAGGTTGMVLTVRDQSGEVIAKKRQSGSIPAAGSGTATWALRLADDGSGIQYDVDNSGDWLDVATTSHEPGTHAGMQFDATEGIWFGSGGNAPFSPHSGDFVVDANGQVAISGTGTPGGSGIGMFFTTVGEERHVADHFDVVSTSSSGIELDASGIAGASVTLDANTGGVVMSTIGGVTIALGVAATSVTVLDHIGNPIFRVDENGDLHGKTGKALVFDL